MPAVLTHKSIMLLARERLRQIAEQMEAKARQRTVPATDIELKLAWLARKSFDVLSTPPAPSATLPGEPYVRPLGQGVSKFAVMGTMGPDIPGFSAIFRAGQAWVFDLVHKGNSDSNMELVVAGTSDLAIQIWREVAPLLRAAYPNPADAATLDIWQCPPAPSVMLIASTSPLKCIARAIRARGSAESGGATSTVTRKRPERQACSKLAGSWVIVDEGGVGAGFLLFP